MQLFLYRSLHYETFHIIDLVIILQILELTHHRANSFIYKIIIDSKLSSHKLMLI